MPVNIHTLSPGKPVLLLPSDRTQVSGGREIGEAEEPTLLYFSSGPRKLALDAMCASLNGSPVAHLVAQLLQNFLNTSK